MAAKLPDDERGWFRLVLSNQPPLWRLLAESCGGHVLAEPGVQAAFVPASPQRSFFNSVFFSDAEALLAALPRLAEEYERLGIEAWTVWVPEGESEVAEALRDAGHRLDAEPRAMGLSLGELRTPEPDPELSIHRSLEMTELSRINEIAYGYLPGDFPLMSPWADAFGYLAELDDEPVATTLAWDRGEDCEITFVATLPEARGRGVARRLMAEALADARERGRLASTLIATRLGFPVYASLGYRDVGGLQMWERRRAAAG